MSDDGKLVLTIDGDASGAKKSIDDVSKAVAESGENIKKAGEAAEGLFHLEALEKFGEVSKEVFNVLKEQLVGSLEAYKDQEQASRQLNLTLQNQGIYTDALAESYKEYASETSRLTGFQADEIVKAQTIAQTFLGQLPVTEDLTKAIADLAQQQGISLPQAAETLGKAIGQGTGQLKRQGLSFSDTATEAERYSQTLEFVQIKAGGAAEAANTGLGAIRGLQNAFHESSEELGKRFAPAAEAVIGLLTDFITPAEESTGLMQDFKAAVIVAGLAVSALGIALPIMAQGFIILKAAAKAASIEITATKVALAGLGIGVVIFLITELALNWEKASGRIIAVVKGLVEFVSGAFKGLGSVISGAFKLNPDKIKEGLKEIEDAFKGGVATASAEIPKATEKSLGEQDAIKKKFADKDSKRRSDEENAKIQLQKAEDEAILLELNNASKDQIDLKNQEIQTLKALEKTKNKEQKELLKERVEQIRAQEDEQRSEDIDRDVKFESTKQKVEQDAIKKGVAFKTNVKKSEIASIRATQLTESEIEKKSYTDRLKLQIASDNKFLEEKNKYNVAVAALSQFLNTSEVQGTKQATGELVALQNSKNAQLKSIGKAAAVAQIVIKTAESAINIYEGFSSIPFIGPVLGVAGAAAAIAYGAEQIGNVTAAASGSLVQGSGYGDKVPYMLEPGELVAPKKNFEEVISGVAAERGLVPSGESQEVGGVHTVAIGFDGREAQSVITARTIEAKSLGTLRQRT